jgi:hypothetical protein
LEPDDVPAPTQRINEEVEQEAREEAGLPEAAARSTPERPHEPRKPAPSQPVEPGALPKGREEERRGHALPNTPGREDDPTLGAPLGRDEEQLHGVHDV